MLWWRAGRHVKIDIPWNVPEAHIQLDSAGVIDLDDEIQDVFGLCNKRPDAAGVRVTLGLGREECLHLSSGPAGPGQWLSQ